MSPVPSTVGSSPNHNPWAIDPQDIRTGIFSYAILGLMLLAFVCMIAVDMFRKHRTGELQESMMTLAGFIKLLVVTMPRIMLDPRNLYKAWILFTDQFRKAENKRYDKKKESEKNRDTPEKEFDSAAIIQRMHSMSSSDKSPTNTSKGGSPEKGKEKEPFFVGPLKEVKLVTTDSSAGINLQLIHGAPHGSSPADGCGAGSSSSAAGGSGPDCHTGISGSGGYTAD